jgi:uncharacterized membrane protein
MVERKRHLAKAVTYRVFGSAATAFIAFGATGDVGIGASVGALDSVLKIGLYYLHERLWYRVKWGIRGGGSGESFLGCNSTISVRPVTPAPRQEA